MKRTPEEQRALNAQKMREYRRQHPERVAATAKKCRDNDPDKHREQKRLEYVKHVETYRQRSSEYRDSHKEALKEMNRKWREANVQKIELYREINKDKREQYDRERWVKNTNGIQERQKARVAEHREECRESTRKWREAHKEEVNAKSSAAMRKLRAENPDKYRAICRQYYADHAEQCRESRRQYVASHPDLIAANGRNRRAAIRSAQGSHTAQDIQRLFKLQHGRCATCKDQLKTSGADKYHVDHVMPLILGGSNNTDNLQLLCRNCNLHKNAMHPDDWAHQNGRLFC